LGGGVGRVNIIGIAAAELVEDGVGVLVLVVGGGMAG